MVATSENKEIIAKDIVVALIQKCSADDKPEQLLDFACEAFDKIYKHLGNTFGENSQEPSNGVNSLKELKDKS